MAEIMGTMILILFGIGVNANNSLKDTYAEGTGWVLITFGWGLAVFCGVIVAGPISGAHLNPAVTVGLAVAGSFPWEKVLPFIAAQCIGASLGCMLVWLSYKKHFDRTSDVEAKLGTFATGGAIHDPIYNLISEIIGTFALVFVILYIAGPDFTANNINEVNIGLGSVGAIPVALLVVVIGMALGGSTGYAINPARDFVPRLMHFLLPIGDKRDSNWGYSWVPIVGPILGGVAAGMLYLGLG